MPTIHVTARDGSRHEIAGDVGISLMENLRDYAGGKLEIAAVCGGCCSCATCHVHIEPGWAAKLPARSDDELVLLEESAHFDETKSRLSCQIDIVPALDGLVVTVAPED